MFAIFFSRFSLISANIKREESCNMPRIASIILLTLALLGKSMSLCGQSMTAQERLDRAIDYFQSEKYHEAGIILSELDRNYRLNSRYRAFLAVCRYRDNDYAATVEILDSIIPQLTSLSPDERAVYDHIAAESHFALGHYADAATYYDSQLSLCHDDERGDTLYRLGLCLMFQSDYANAYDRFVSALAYFINKPQANTTEARIRQTEHLAAGCRDKMTVQKPAE